MPILTYLSFNGNCRQAFDFYKEVFGGEYLMLETFANGPAEMGIPEAEFNNVMHASLSIGDGVIMGSDSPSNFGPPPVVGNNFSLTFPTQSREETDALFAKISEGGTVTMQPADMFWGAYFGSCIDKFSINWQFNFETPQQ